MASISWRIESLVWDTATGGVTTAHWRVLAEDDGHTADAYGSIGFSPDPESANFIALDDLSEETVLEWVQAHDELAGLEDDLLRQIAKKKNPVSETGLPW